MQPRSLGVAVTLCLALYSCKQREATSALRGTDGGAPATDLADAPPPPDCGELDPTLSETMSGAAIFDLTSRCVFNRDVHDVHIRILAETFQKVLDDGCADKDSGFGHVIELVFDGKSIQDVGIKVRGNTSRCNPKRQFKFKFDVKEAFSVFQGAQETKTFPANDGRTFFGLEGFSVRTSGNDPSMIRERISSKVVAATESLAPTTERGAPVYRVAFTKFYVSHNRAAAQGPESTFTRLIDGYYYDYKGFYSLAENIDKTYLRTRFEGDGTKLSGFYSYQADQAEAYFEKEKYKSSGWHADYANGKKVGDAATTAAAKAKLFELFSLLASNPSEADLAAQIDVENVVNYVSSAMLNGHWDSILANRNNDILFFNGGKMRWQIIAWDLDNTQGALIDQYHGLMSSDIFKPAKANKGKLFEVLFAEIHPGFRAKLQGRLKALLTGPESEANFNQTVDALEGTVQSSVEGWEGYSHQAFQDIKYFSAARRNAILPQL